MIEITKSPLLSLNRRLLLQSGIFGLAAISMPGAAQIMSARGFTHGVASGEPDAQSVLLWTRYVGTKGGTKLRAEISNSMDFTTPISGGDVMATPARDHIAKIILSGLKPARHYYYRFIAEDGSISPIGRTRTLPAGKTPDYTMAVFSCANMPFGWFNAYGHANQRNDIDLVILLGDYLYEYRAGNYPSFKESVAGRFIEPRHEIYAIADYRLRYASYRADPDLQRLHQLYPVIAMWDDHEFANDTWQDGAENHQTDEGDWAARKAAAEMVWREWMPVRDITDGNRWSRYQIGDLATIHMTESRITARSKQVEFDAVTGSSAQTATAIKALRDDVWQDPARTMLGSTQEKWLADGFTNNKTPWNIWAQQTVMGTVRQGPGMTDLLNPASPDFLRDRILKGEALGKLGLPSNMDAWDGYPAARARSLKAAQSASADLIVLSGDSHNGWAFDLPAANKPAGVEFAGHSVSSPGLEAYFSNSDALAKMIVAANPELQWMNCSKRGYMMVSITPKQVASEWIFMDSIKTRSTAVSGSQRMMVHHGKRVMENA